MTEEQLAPVFRVANTDASVDWYRRLGFLVECEWSSGPALGHTVVSLRRGELALIITNRDEEAHAEGLVYMRVSDVEAIADEFDVDVKRRGVGSFVELRDPDGNRLRIGTLWINPADLKGPRWRMTEPRRE